MQKRGVVLMAALVLTVFLLVVAYSQEDMTAIDNSVFPDPRRTAAIFNHEEHNEAAELDECNQCHHVYEDGVKLEDESSEDMLCSECHLLEDTDEQPGLRKAFHLNCKGCHLAQNQGPVMCGECHIK